MKKRSIFGKLLAIAMVFAGFSLTSCDENDNAIINGKVWVRPEVKLVDGGAIITGSSTADINRMLSRVRQEIIQAANKGEKFTIDIEGPALDVSGSDNTISILTPTGGDLVVNFKSTITADTPLTLESSGVADDAVSTASTNKVEINVPSASGIDLQINMPTTTVTLNAASGSLNIDELITKTAINTLNISKGITVNWLKVDGGRAVVEDGAKVLGYVRNGDEGTTFAYKDGVEPIMKELADEDDNPIYDWDVIYPIEEGKAIKPYYVQNLKIAKGKAAFAYIYIRNGQAKDALESIIIEDGAAATIYIDQWDGYNDEDDGHWVYAPSKGVKMIKGLGNRTAKIYPSLSINNTEEGKTYGSYLTLLGIKELINVSIDGTIVPNVTVYDEDKDEDVHLGDIEAKFGHIDNVPKSTDCDFITVDHIGNISPNCENCTFRSLSMSFTHSDISGNSSTIKNCKFESSDEESSNNILLPYQTKDRSSFNFGFDTCKFGKGFKFTTRYDGEKPWLDKDGKPVTKAYFWYELEEDGVTIKTDDWDNPILKKSASEADIPAANKANGLYANNGYWINEDTSGLKEDATFKDYKGYVSFTNSTIDGKAITSKSDLIISSQWAIDNITDEKGNATTQTYFVIDGATYEPVFASNENKWRLIEVEE